MAEGGRDVCPGCGAGTDGDRWCGVCGLDLAGPEASELRELATELAAIEVELNAIRVRRDAVATDLAGKRWRADRRATDVVVPVPAFAAAERPPSTPGTGEWGVERIRNLLLWTGATLLALSALAFTAVAWTHLGPGGRAILLVAITLVSAFLASGLRRRLPATAGAFTGLTIALALVDWQVARRAGAAPGLSTAAWWAIGTAVVGALSVGLGRIASPVPAHRAIALLVPGSAILTVAATANAAWSGALGLAMIAAALVAADQLLGSRRVDPVVRATLRATAGAVWVGGAVLALAAALVPATFQQTFAPAGVLLALAVAPGLVLARSRGADPGARVTMTFVMLAAVIGAALTLASTSVGPIGMLTFAAVLGGACMAVAPSLAEVWSRAAQSVGLTAAAPGLAFAVVEGATAVLGPTAWLGQAWTGTTRARAVNVIAGPHTTRPTGIGWCAVAILAVVAVAIATSCLPRRGVRRVHDVPIRQAGAVGLALMAIVLAPVAAGASAFLAFAVAIAATSVVLVGSALASRRRPERALVSALLVLLAATPATGWAALTRATSITALAIIAVSALLAVAVGRAAPLRAAYAAAGAGAVIGLASVATLASGASRPVAGFVGVVVAGFVLLVGSLVRRDAPDGLAAEIVGGLGMLGGALLAVPSRVWVAAALTAMVPLLLGASTRRGRTIVYGAAAGAAALGATWAWLASAGVTVVEAYTLPAAALALAGGAFARRVGRAQSWFNLGPAVVLALAPTLALAIARNDDGRAIVVGIAAVAIILLGAWRRLQAPLVLGALTLLALGVEKLGPQAVRLPRWTMLAIAGALLLWVGTTFERRRDDVQRAARHLVELG